MNTAKRTLLSAAIVAALICCCSFQANAMEGGPAGPQGGMKVLRSEPVDQFFRPTTNSANALQRVVCAGANGQFLAQVTAPNGAVLMEGIYNDLQCRVPNGPFTYYHANGRVSARGSYAMGTKTGVWQRFDEGGSVLAERVYTGSTKEQEELQFDEVSRAPMGR